mgnify:CR=1 FL=1
MVDIPVSANHAVGGLIGQNSGTVTNSFANGTVDGNLVAIDKEYNIKKKFSTAGNDPCHISMNHSGDVIVVTNYSSGSFAMFELLEGLPVNLSHFVMHEGNSTNPQRQQSPHPHSSLFSQSDDILFVADLGTDILYYYSYEQK